MICFSAQSYWLSGYPLQQHSSLQPSPTYADLRSHHSRIRSCVLTLTQTRPPAFIRIRPLQSIVTCPCGSSKLPVQQPLGAAAASATTYSASCSNMPGHVSTLTASSMPAAPKFHALSITTRDYGRVATYHPGPWLSCVYCSGIPCSAYLQ